jgi:hypothetical protein
MRRVVRSKRLTQHLGTKRVRRIIMRNMMQDRCIDWWERVGIVRCYELGSRAREK